MSCLHLLTVGQTLREKMADEIGRTWQNMRACYFCSLIKTLQQFEKEGCDNCSFLRLDRSAEKARECTTPNFEG